MRLCPTHLLPHSNIPGSHPCLVGEEAASDLLHVTYESLGRRAAGAGRRRRAVLGGGHRPQVALVPHLAPALSIERGFV